MDDCTSTSRAMRTLYTRHPDLGLSTWRNVLAFAAQLIERPLELVALTQVCKLWQKLLNAEFWEQSYYVRWGNPTRGGAYLNPADPFLRFSRRLYVQQNWQCGRCTYHHRSSNMTNMYPSAVHVIEGTMATLIVMITEALTQLLIFDAETSQLLNVIDVSELRGGADVQVVAQHAISFSDRLFALPNASGVSVFKVCDTLCASQIIRKCYQCRTLGREILDANGIGVTQLTLACWISVGSVVSYHEVDNHRSVIAFWGKEGKLISICADLDLDITASDKCFLSGQVFVYCVGHEAWVFVGITDAVPVRFLVSSIGQHMYDVLFLHDYVLTYSQAVPKGKGKGSRKVHAVNIYSQEVHCLATFDGSRLMYGGSFWIALNDNSGIAYIAAHSGGDALVKLDACTWRRQFTIELPKAKVRSLSSNNDKILILASDGSDLELAAAHGGNGSLLWRVSAASHPCINLSRLDMRLFDASGSSSFLVFGTFDAGVAVFSFQANVCSRPIPDSTTIERVKQELPAHAQGGDLLELAKYYMPDVMEKIIQTGACVAGFGRACTSSRQMNGTKCVTCRQWFCDSCTELEPCATLKFHTLQQQITEIDAQIAALKAQKESLRASASRILAEGGRVCLRCAVVPKVVTPESEQDSKALAIEIPQLDEIPVGQQQDIASGSGSDSGNTEVKVNESSSDIQEALRQSEAEAIHREGADVAEALLRSKLDMEVDAHDLSRDEIVIFRLTQHSSEINAAILECGELQGCLAEVLNAGFEPVPDYAGGAKVLVPLPQAMLEQLDAKLQPHHIVAKRRDRELIERALRMLPCRRRPKLREDQIPIDTMPSSAHDNNLGRDKDATSCCMSVEANAGASCEDVVFRDETPESPLQRPCDQVSIVEESTIDGDLLHRFLRVQISKEVSENSRFANSAPCGNEDAPEPANPRRWRLEPK